MQALGGMASLVTIATAVAAVSKLSSELASKTDLDRLEAKLDNKLNRLEDNLNDLRKLIVLALLPGAARAATEQIISGSQGSEQP